MDKKSDGPTVFDINKPRTIGAAPSARPVITGHQPTMPDPMVRARESASSGSSKIAVNFDEESTASKKPGASDDNLDTAKLADAMFSTKTPGAKPVSLEEPSGPPAILAGEPQLSPPFTPDKGGNSDAQRAPFMPVSDLTGIDTAAVKTTSDVSDSQVTTGAKPAVYGSHSDPSNRRKASGQKKSGTKVLLIFAILLVALSGVYAAIDKDLILSNVDLPLHIFKQEETTTTSQPTKAQASIPAGFTATKLVEANLGFNYPTAWGGPTAAVDKGFTQRKPGAEPDANYAFVVDFPNNKDVQLAITSGKYLPPLRPENSVLYYDFLAWCTGTVDDNYYVGVLKYVTNAEKVDKPGTIACDQGPLAGTTKISSDTIVQTNIKNSAGTVLGDIYTKNLTAKTYVVARAKDTSMKNADQIKVMLESIKPL